MLSEKEYYIGLDCGTESVGFAVTDTEYNVLKFNGKSMWGTRVFEEASTAADRRMHRSARRRYERKKERIRLLQGLFAEEIAKIDPLFFQRLNDSHYFPEDKTYTQPNSLFDDPDYKDKDFFKEYPTIFHLRNALRKGEAKHDPRLLYLALHHILKNRGHFLFTVSDDFKAVMDLSPLLKAITEVSSAVYDNDEIVFPDVDKVRDALKEKRISSRSENLKNLIGFEDAKQKTLFIKLLAGSKVKTAQLFGNDEYKDLPDIDFRKASFEDEDLPSLEDALSDDEYQLIIHFKAVYDWALLSGIMEGRAYISEAKIIQYEKNKDDLQKLRRAIRLHAPDKYNEFFHGHDKGSFAAYIGADHDDGKKTHLRKGSVDDFYSMIRKLIGKDPEDDDSSEILDSIQDSSFLPLLISFRNSVIPYQVHKAEMDEILRVASNDYDFLNKKDETGLSVIQKIDAILTYRIPYYIGPLGRNDKAVSGWAVRKKDGKILPWNFNDMIDEDASAEGFIRRMTNKCTYLHNEDVLPKSSLLYSRFLVLNELNNVTINGDRLSVEQKQIVYDKLFRKVKKVTQNRLKQFLVSEGWYKKKEEIVIGGIDGDFKSTLAPYIDFRKYIDNKKLKVSDVEEIIKWLTLFSDGGDIARRKIEAAYKDVLTSQDIKDISKMKYSGWGRLSEKFLSEIYTTDKRTGEIRSIITMLWETQNNLMELLSADYDFAEQTENRERIEKLDYSVVDELYVSPSVKRQIWQTLKIVDELEHIMGHAPKKVFLEVTRENQKDKKRTKSRKDSILERLRIHNRLLSDDEKEILKAIENFDSSMITKRDKLYLYFTQMGKCMYTGTPINIEKIGDTDVYDVDHIYPFSRSGDDSTLNNKVLVLKTENSRKSNNYPINESVRNRMSGYWKHLLDLELISDEKYKRLTRATPLTDEDDKGFIARQLVETSQSAKATAEILKRYFDGKTKIVYSKAGHVSDFRQQFDFPKLRSLNSLHHAKDAYLNIVVGNVYDTKYAQEYYHSKASGETLNLAKPFETSVPGAWVYAKEGTLLRVRKQMQKNDILYTKQCIEVGGALFDLMPVAAGSKNGVRPLKSSDPVLLAKIEQSADSINTIDEWTRKYGGYNSSTTAYFSLVRYKDKKGKPVVSFIPIAIIDTGKIKTDADLLEYCREQLQLREPEIVRRRILKNTQISIDGYRFCITGKSDGGARILLESAIPLLLNDWCVKKLKRIERFLERKRLDSNLKIDSEFDGITAEDNIKLYREFVKKATLPIYLKRPSCQAKNITEGEVKFGELPIEDQCVVLSNLLVYFGMGGGICDLSLIDAAKKAGTYVANAEFKSGGKKLVLYDQSITGLFEKTTEIEV